MNNSASSSLRLSAPVTLFAAVGLLLSACGGDEKPAEPAAPTGNETSAAPAEAPKGESAAAPAPSAGALKFAFVVNNPSTFWTIAEAGVKKAAAEFGVECEMRTPSSGAVDQQQQIIEDLIAKKIGGMAISPIDPANMTGVLNEACKHMPVITQDSDAPESNRLAYIGTNNYEAGKVAGAEIKKALPEGGKIMIFVGRLDAQNAQDRKRGIEDAITGTKITIADTRLDYGDQAKAKQNVEDALTAHPDLALMTGLWSYNGPAIVTAVKEAGKAGKIKIVVFDEEDAVLQAIEEGVAQSTIVQKPFEFGYQSVRLLAEIAKGDKSRIPENKMIDTGVVIVDKASVGEFRANLKAILGK